MQNTISITCPVEMLLGLHTNAETFGELVKLYAAIALFKEGRISSGMASTWLNIPRVTFLWKALEAGAEFLENSHDDFERETSLL